MPSVMRISLPKLRGKKHKSKSGAVVPGDDTNSIASQSKKSASSKGGSKIGTVPSSSDAGTTSTTKFANGIVVKPINETVLLDQATESLQTALNLIDEATDFNHSWVDARDVLDKTAAALDDAGLALRGSGGSKSSNTATRSRTHSHDSKSEVLVKNLADSVIQKRRSLLGDVLVHSSDGVWTKCMYGMGDGFSFDCASDALEYVPEEEKKMKALIVFASQTGTAKGFAYRLQEALGGDDYCVVRNVKMTTLQDIARFRRVYFICSTFGSGRPPSDGEIFYSLSQLAALRCEGEEENADYCEGEAVCEKPLKGTSVAIAALGSSEFRHFAQFGFGLDSELSSLGASRALDVTTLDVKDGKDKQDEAYQIWEEIIVGMEKDRLEGWEPKSK